MFSFLASFSFSFDPLSSLETLYFSVRIVEDWLPQWLNRLMLYLQPVNQGVEDFSNEKIIFFWKSKVGFLNPFFPLIQRQTEVSHLLAYFPNVIKPMAGAAWNRDLGAWSPKCISGMQPLESHTAFKSVA